MDSSGNLNWTPSKSGMPSLPGTNIRGPQGPQGPAGADGAPGAQGPAGQDGNDGADATINGVNALMLNVTGGLNGQQSGNTYTIDGEDLKAKNATVTLLSSGWMESNGRYTQTVSCSIVSKNTPVVIVDVRLTGSDTTEDNEVLSAWAGPASCNVDQGNGTLTFYSAEAPTKDIPVNVGVL